MRGISGLLALASLASLFFTRANAQQAERPNVLILLTDDQRLDALATMPRTVTKLRREGTEFVNAVAVTPTCCPSRATIMSGQYPHNHGTFFRTPRRPDGTTRATVSRPIYMPPVTSRP